MKRKLVFIALILFFALALTASGKGYQVENLSIDLHGISYDFSPMSAFDYGVELGCRLDTGAVDVCMVFDTTGSMYGTITNVRATIGAFITELETRGYDYRLGGVTFGDGQTVWDFDPATPGWQMTGNRATYQAKLATVGADGGMDGPETSWDAMYYAMVRYDWRPDAMHVIIMFTDAPSCAIDAPVGYGCCCDAAMTTYLYSAAPNPYNLALSAGFVVYTVASTSGIWQTWYQNIALDTGGRWYPLATAWATIFTDVAAMISTYTAVNMRVINTFGTSCAITARFVPVNPSCVSVLSTNPVTSPPTPSGGAANMDGVSISIQHAQVKPLFFNYLVGLFRCC